jgi:hypothetical protein
MSVTHHRQNPLECSCNTYLPYSASLFSDLAWYWYFDESSVGGTPWSRSSVMAWISKISLSSHHPTVPCGKICSYTKRALSAELQPAEYHLTPGIQWNNKLISSPFPLPTHAGVITTSGVEAILLTRWLPQQTPVWTTKHVLHLGTFVSMLHTSAKFA